MRVIKPGQSFLYSTPKGGLTHKTPKKTIKTAPTFDSLIAQIYGSYMSEKEMRQQSRKDVNLAIQDSMRQLRSVQQRQLEEVYRARFATQAAQQAVAAAGAGDAAAARAAWQSAGAASGAANQGFVNAVEQAQAANAAGASTIAGAMGQDTSILPGGAAANAAVGQHLGVTLPAPVFGARGEAAFAANELTREQALAKFRDLAPGYENQLSDIRDRYTMAVQDLLAKRPGLVQEAIRGYRGENRSDLATMIQANYLQSSLRQAQAGLTGIDPVTGKPTVTEKQRRFTNLQTAQATELAKRKLAAEIKAANRDAKIAAEEANIEYGRIDAPASRAAGWLVDRAGRVIAGPNGKPIPVARSTTGGTGGFTALQRRALKKEALGAAREAKFGVPAEGLTLEEAKEDNDWLLAPGSMDPRQVLTDLVVSGIPYPIALAAVRRHFPKAVAAWGTTKRTTPSKPGLKGPYR